MLNGLVGRVLSRSRIGLGIQASRHGALVDYGWFRSVLERASIDGEGEPLPWIAYPCIDFLKGRLPEDLTVFEYGCGNGTLWWARHARSVVACEHEAEWYERIRARVPGNVRLLHVELEYGAAYAATVAREGTFDIVIVDGRDRVNCMRAAVGSITPRGVIILDNSERTEYRDGIEFLRTSGFRCVDFWGMAPSIGYKTCTSIFYRDGNCLGI